MLEPVSTGVAITLLVKSAPAWLPAISDALIPPVRDALLGKSAERTFDWLGGQRRKIFHLDEKEQKRHLELALKNAVERGLAQFHAADEQQKYTGVISVLSTSHADALRREAMRLFTLNDEPDFEKLAMLFDQARSQAQPMQGQAIDASPYLASFFESLIAELYADPYFRQQMSDVLQVRAGLNMQRSLVEVLSTLNQIGEILADNYKPEQFEKDVLAYTSHVERTLRYLKLVGVVPKERTNENRDPELDGIFVPLRIAAQENIAPNQKTPDSLVDFLVQTCCMVLLGSPGSGKSTATRYLAWSHAVANLANSTSLTNTPLVSGKPLPLRIELRRLNEDRRQRPEYDFLSYASEVLLGRAGLNVPPQMFELLLERRAMLLLFDGLDEVATLDDRRTLVEEIDSFARQYPGNHFIVTSRPVGYNLAPLSTQTFAEVYVQPFDDEQIHLFLENWYAHVLRLSPLSPDDRQELEELHTNLKDNPRLHALAENPLLLTVITALHRYERLPDKRILVYDRCADLLLETWARLKGTNARWQDLKLSKEDQYACIAHLGLILHLRAQEKQGPDVDVNSADASTDSTAVEVPSRFMLQKIEQYLQQQKLFQEKADQHTQARRFLELMQEEAGLIVERGSDENGESVYGFAHRTFQEYFAAVDVYERYRQEEDPTIISDFLVEHLHDPHWNEAILLLFGKLGRKPATRQLRQILEGKIQSRRSRYTDIVQQDLFFVSSCLIEEISLENDLAGYVGSQLVKLVKNSPFKSQRLEVLEVLGDLMQTRQYADLGCGGLINLLKDATLDSGTKIEVARILYLNTPIGAEEEQQAIQTLLHLEQQTDLFSPYAFKAVEILYQISLNQSKEQELATQLLLQFVQYPDVPVEQVVRIAQSFFLFSPTELAAHQIPSQLLLKLVQRPDLSIKQVFLAIVEIYWLNCGTLDEPQLATLILLYIAQDTKLSIELAIEKTLGLDQSGLDTSEEPRRSLQELRYINQFFNYLTMLIIQVTLHHYSFNPKVTETQQTTAQMLLHLSQNFDLTFEQTRIVYGLLYKFSSKGSAEEQLATQMLLHLAQRFDLSIEQAIQAALELYCSSAEESEEERLGSQMLLHLAQRPDLSIEQAIQAAYAFYSSSHKGSEEERLATQMLLHLAQRPDLSIEQAIQAASAFYLSSAGGSEEERLATQMLLHLAQRPELSVEQITQVAFALYWSSDRGSEEERLGGQILLQLARRPDLSIEQAIEVAKILYWCSSQEDRKFATPLLLNLAQNGSLEPNQRLKSATEILTMQSKYLERVQAAETVFSLLQQEDAGQHIERYWSPMNLGIKPEVSEIPLIAELAKQVTLPPMARDEMYIILHESVPQFDQLDKVDD